MVQTFGLKKGQPTPDPADVDTALDKNTNALLDVVQGLVNGISQTIMDNGQKLDGVVKRLTNSINGHLRKNAGLMKPVGNELVSHVDNYIAQNQSLIQTAASDPAIADYVRSVPAAAGYTLSTPVAPPPPPTIPPVTSTAPGAEVYRFYENCTTGQIMAVPESALVGPWAGWYPPLPWKWSHGGSFLPTEIPSYLGRWGKTMLAQSCAGTIPPG